VRFLFDRRDKKDIVAIRDNKDNLSRIPPLVRVNQNVFQPVFLNRSNDFFKGYAPTGLELFILVRISGTGPSNARFQAGLEAEAQRKL
jgi:hypothetical protein